MRAHTAPETSAQGGHGPDVRVEGPDCLVDDADLHRLFPRQSLATSRSRLRAGPRVSVTVAGHLVAVATCQPVLCEMRVPAMAVDIPSTGLPLGAAISEDLVLQSLLDAVELMSLAGGCRRILLHFSGDAHGLLERRGYVAVENPAHAGWVAKSIG